MSSTFKHIQTIISNLLHIDPSHIKPSCVLKASPLKADSLDLVNLLMVLSTEFKVDIDHDKIQQIITVDDLVNYVEKNKQGEKRYT